jgi:predicted deacetylase
MTSDEVWAALEAARRNVATSRHMLEFAHPDAVQAWSARLEHAEAEEQDLLAQLAQLASKR